MVFGGCGSWGWWLVAEGGWEWQQPSRTAANLAEHRLGSDGVEEEKRKESIVFVYLVENDFVIYLADIKPPKTRFFC